MLSQELHGLMGERVNTISTQNIEWNDRGQNSMLQEHRGGVLDLKAHSSIEHQRWKETENIQSNSPLYRWKNLGLE